MIYRSFLYSNTRKTKKNDEKSEKSLPKICIYNENVIHFVVSKDKGIINIKKSNNELERNEKIGYLERLQVRETR